jgi:hypothetical protein
MTALKPNQPLKRETATVYRGRTLLVELHPSFISLREKGRRRSIIVDYRAVLDLGFKLLARAAREERAAKRGRK